MLKSGEMALEPEAEQIVQSVIKIRRKDDIRSDSSVKTDKLQKVDIIDVND